MAMLGFGDFLCEACVHFNTDGIDGNHPFCYKQLSTLSNRAVILGEKCPYGFEYGIPACYPVHKERNEKRAKEIFEKLKDMEE